MIGLRGSATGSEDTVQAARSGKRISFRGFMKLAGWSFFGTMGCLAVSLTYNYVAFRHLGPDALRQGLISATVLPIALAGPLFFFLTLKLRELAIVNYKLNDLASLDAMTGCLNRRAFAAGVERLLKQGGGALLVIDADRFKSINDRFGHDTGDEALRLIAAAIRSSARQHDLVGRLGGEEFGVFLWQAPQSIALEAANRMLSAVAAVDFRPKGMHHALSISVGCAVGETGAEFASLFRAADQSLYDAKRNGRNRIEIAPAPSVAPELLDLAG